MPEATRILLIEDEALVARAVVRSLRDHSIVLAGTAAEGLAQLENTGSFALVLCDLTLPDRTGVELYTEARARGTVKPAQFVFMTGMVADPQLEALRRRDRLALIEKPFSVDTLRRAVTRALIIPTIA